MFSFFKKKEIVYIIDGAGWSIDWDGKQLKKYFDYNSSSFRFSLQNKLKRCRNKIIHFGSFYLFFKSNKETVLNEIDKTNKIILTIFHVNPIEKEKIELLKVHQERINKIHTSCKLTKDFLVSSGIKEEKINVIPLGVSLEKFKPISEKFKNEIKDNLSLPNNKVIIGSFQKDGNGWGEGLEAKFIKGPDVFCKVVEKLNKFFPVHVLLTGPARGYVKKRFKKNNISFTYNFLKDYLDIVKYYQVLDLYLITSRVEGGPKAVLEAMACGISFVSTKVGMVPDIIMNGINGNIVEINDVEGIFKISSRVLKNDSFGKKMINQALSDIQEYDWLKIAKRYEQEIYLKLI